MESPVQKWEIFDKPKEFVELYATAVFLLLCVSLFERFCDKHNIPNPMHA